MPGIKCKVKVAAYLHSCAGKKAYALKQRILGGQEVHVDASQNSINGYQWARVPEGTELEGKAVADRDFFGYISSRKLLPDTNFVEEFLALQNVGVNGITQLPVDFGKDSYYQRELAEISNLCYAIFVMVELQKERQSELKGLRKNIKTLSWLQIAASGAGFTIAVAGSVASMGVLAPVFLVLGYAIVATSGGAGLGASLISSRIDEINGAVTESTGGIVGKMGAKGTAGYTGKQATVSAAGEFGGAGAASVVSSALGGVGAVIGVASGVKRLANANSRSNRIAPSEVVGAVPWAKLLQELRRKLDEITGEKRVAGDVLAHAFEQTIETINATIKLLEPLAKE